MDLEGRVGKLEVRADKSDKKLDAHDIDIEELKRRLAAVEGMEMPVMTEVKEVANLDTAGIMKSMSKHMQLSISPINEISIIPN